MKQIKALIRKEFLTHWGAMLLPAWFTLGVIVTMVVGLIWALIQGADISIFANLKSFGGEYDKIVLWGLGLAGSSGLAMLAMLTGIGLADTILNSSNKKRCEIFHLSQPVSLAKIVGVKYGLVTLGTYLQVIAISLAGVSVMGTYIAYKLHLSPGYAFTGMLQGLSGMILPFFFTCSLYWMFAGIFKNASFIKSMFSLGGIEIARLILSKTTVINFPSLSAYLLKLSGLGNGINVSFADKTVTSLGGGSADAVINRAWAMAFDEYTWQRILFSLIFFAVGYWFYSRRELN
ncbi:MAG TPA: hypothetical protein P5533_00360 [Candidatus Cloacimonadota bacterium]|nr:hypothetical protein [Candidatus Cloacimonadota bacterium]